MSCELCQKLFTSSAEYDEHFETTHGTVENKECVVCEVCGKSCVSQAILNIHMTSHTEESVQANSNYWDKSKKYECHICAKKFQTPSKLQRHMTVHRDILDPSEVPERPPKDFKYECEVCEKRVETPSKLVRHMRVHDKINSKYVGINQHRPHPCTDCSLRFWDSSKLERHKIIHSEDFERSTIQHSPERLFICVICLATSSVYEDCIQVWQAGLIINRLFNLFRFLFTAHERSSRRAKRKLRSILQALPKVISKALESSSSRSNSRGECNA